MSAQPLKIAIVGAGHRSLAYADYALKHPDRMKVVAVAEPSDVRRARTAELHGVPADSLFRSFEEMAAKPKLADAVINGTMDRMHFASSVPFIEKGYDLLLEKPIARTEREVRDLIALAGRHGRKVMICHVLRYAPFYAKVKEVLDSGAIGSLVAVHTSENVSYHHMAVGFIRGRWSNTERSNPMLLAKCCHDTDILAWLFSGVPARRVASFGSLMQFKPENAPEGSTKRCLDGCEIEAACPYSARINYLVKKKWQTYAWEPIEHLKNPTEEQKLESLRTDNPYGRCVWHCDNDVVDHQAVIVEFANGATATHNMLCATARATRTIHLVGSAGELEGDMDAGRLELRKPTLVPGPECTRETIDLGTAGSQIDSGHGGGDGRLVEDFVRFLRGEPASKATTRIEDSLTGHLIAFCADTAMRERRVVEMPV